ncbi:MAG TPA: BatA domain-containing protein [Saprospiraceae bacterium]|nr:BatA domain-containing protein [Saprospiraceae bacterium]
MQFLYPAFLWALTALAIPIILHLFYFRRYKKVYFSNLRFLREVREETSARNRLRNLLILLARLLAMAFIILAFAQPVIPLKNAVKAGIKDVSVFIDNSFSMQSFGKDLSLFDKSRQKAKEIILGYSTEDRFQVIGHELSAAQQQWVGRDEALIRLEEMEFTPDVKPLSVVIGRQKQSFSRENGNPVSWIISDFQKTITDISDGDSTIPINILPLRGVQEKNVAIDTAWFESPIQTLNQTSVLLYSLHNYADEDADNIRVTLVLDGQEKPDNTVDIASGRMITDTAKITVLTTGWHELAIRISDFPVTFDDTYYLTFYVDEHLRILSINEQSENKKIAAIFANSEYFILDQSLSNNIQYANFPDYNLIIVNELTHVSSGLMTELKKYVEEGGKVLFFPSASGPIDQYNAFLRTMGANEFQAWEVKERQVGSINTEAFIYKDVFTRTRPNMRLPKVSGSFNLTSAGRKGQTLLAFRDGGDFISFYTPGKGAFSVVSSPLDENINDLTLQPEIFVPLVYKMAIYTSDARRLSYTIGVDHLVPLDRNDINLDEEVKMTGSTEFIPGISALGSKILLDVLEQVKTSGFYKVTQNDAPIASLAFNYDRKESDLALASVDELSQKKNIKVWDTSDETDFTQLIESTQQGKPLWKWCIILSLIFIAAEIALIRLWKI